MKNLKSLLVLSLLAVSLSACSIIFPVGATSNAVGSKVGRAKATVFLGVLAFNQDASIMAAAKNGGISKISTVDMKMTSLLHIIDTYETIVTGE